MLVGADARALVERRILLGCDHATGVTRGNVCEAVGAAYRRVSHKVAMAICIASRL